MAITKPTRLLVCLGMLSELFAALVALRVLQCPKRERFSGPVVSAAPAALVSVGIVSLAGAIMVEAIVMSRNQAAGLGQACQTG